MSEILKHILSSFFQGSIWREAFKSLLYFFILFVILFFPVKMGLDYFYGDMVEASLADTFHLSIMFFSFILSALFGYLLLVFFRDSYFYRIVRNEIGENVGISGGIAFQIKSLLRVGFLLLATIVGISISFFMPVIGFLLMSFCFALEVFSYVFDEGRVGLGRSMKFVSGNFLAVFMLGIFCFSSSLIPGLGLVTYPVSVRAATLFFKTKVINATS